MSKQDGAAATRRFDEGGERVQPLPLAGAAVRLNFLFDAIAGSGEILRAPEEPGFGGVPIAARSARLLAAIGMRLERTTTLPGSRDLLLLYASGSPEA